MKRLLMALLLFVVAILILRRFAGWLARAASTAGPSAHPRARSTELVRDRTCNTFVPKDRAIALKSGGQTHYFCSDACRTRFLSGSSRGSDAA